MSTRLSFSALLLAAPLLVAACGGETPPPATAATTSADPAKPAGGSGTASLMPSGSAGSQKAERRTSASWTACHATAKVDAKGDPTAQVEAMASACASTTGMHKIGTFKGSQAAANPPQSFPFHAEANHCYRGYAYAAATIQDLDLLIKDSAGAVAGEDSTDDPSPVVLEDGAICFKSADEASIVVSIGAGSGAYGVQVWSD